MNGLEKTVINVGIIDDDETKRTQIMSKLDDFVKGASAEIKERYERYSLNPIELEIKADIEDLLEEILDNDIDALIIDYKLSSYEVAVDYTGVKFAEETDKKYLDFPVFILTSYEGELYQKEIFDAHKVYDFERYMNDDQERIEINRKIVEQCIKRKRQIEEWKTQLEELLPKQGESREIDEKIMDLDTKLEKSFDGEHAIPKELKEKLSGDNFTLLLSKLDDLLRREEESVEDKG